MAEPMASVSPASGKLLAAEEGHISISSGDGKMVLDPPVGEHPGELHLGQARSPLPCHQYELPLSRDQDQPMHEPLPDRIYSWDARFGHEGIPFHLPSINSGWYDPLGRGPEVHYGPYHPHPQFILPPPFGSHQYANYANDLTIHLQPSVLGCGHYVNALPPFHGLHAVEYVNPSGSHEPSAYRPAHHYNPMPSNAGVGLSTQENAKRSATVPEVVSDPSDLPAGYTADASGL